jgi:CbiX
MPRPRQSGRHRRPEPLSAPEDAPTLVLAAPGDPSPSTRSIAEELASLVRADLPGLDARVAFLEGEDEEYPCLSDVLSACRPATGTAPAAIVVPLLAGPDASVTDRLRKTVAETEGTAELTDVLGPHPLLAEALHVRLSEAGLARADRARLFTVATAADGILLATTGGDEAVQAAGVTGVLLAARLAVPVMACGLDIEDSVASTAEALRSSGAGRLALAPCLVGPEVPADVLVRATVDAGCASADALGAYPAVGKLVFTRYAAALGITPANTQAPSR